MASKENVKYGMQNNDLDQNSIFFVYILATHNNQQLLNLVIMFIFHTQ